MKMTTAPKTPAVTFVPQVTSTPFSNGISETEVPHPKGLFGTMEIKTLSAQLTMLYLFGILRFDHLTYTNQSSAMEYSISALLSLVFLATILLAQMGIYREKGSMLFPLFGVQLILWFFVVALSGQLLSSTYQNSEREPRVRLAMVLVLQWILISVHSYCIVIIYRCIQYFGQKKRHMHYLAMQLHRAALADQDDEIVVFEKSDSLLGNKSNRTTNPHRFTRVFDLVGQFNVPYKSK